MKRLVILALTTFFVASVASAQECVGWQIHDSGPYNDLCDNSHFWDAIVIAGDGSGCLAVVEGYYNITGGWGYSIYGPHHYPPQQSAWLSDGLSWMAHPRECSEVELHVSASSMDTDEPLPAGHASRMHQWCANNCCEGNQCSVWVALPRFRFTPRGWPLFRPFMTAASAQLASLPQRSVTANPSCRPCEAITCRTRRAQRIVAAAG